MMTCDQRFLAWLFLSSFLAFGCKRSDEIISSSKLADPTHTLDVSFVEETSKIEYKILGEGAESETVTSVKIVQNKRDNVAQWIKEKITGEFLPFATMQGSGYYPDYLLEIKTEHLTCTNQKGAYIGIKGNPIWCTKAAQTPTSETTATDSAKIDDKNTTTAQTASTQTAGTQTASTPTTPKPSQPKAIPNPPAICTGAKIRAYKVCRFFEGGANGCYHRADLNCLFPMSSAVCAVEKGLLTKEFQRTTAFNSSWDCGNGVK